MKHMSALDWIVIILVIIGALNWGLVGVFNLNLVTTFFGVATILSKIIYAIIGLAGLYMIYVVTKCLKG